MWHQAIWQSGAGVCKNSANRRGSRVVAELIRRNHQAIPQTLILSPPSFLPAHLLVSHPLPRSDVVGRTHVMHVPFLLSVSSLFISAPGTVTLDWQIRAGLSAAGLKWCGRLRIRVLGRTSRADWIRLRRLRRLPDYVIVCPGPKADLPGQARVALPSWACRRCSHISSSAPSVVGLVPPTRPGEVLVAADPAALVRLLRLGWACPVPPEVASRCLGSG